MVEKLREPQPIGTCALLMNDEGQVLLGRRKNSYKAGLLGLPGGRVEFNEPIEAAIRREVAEETGLSSLEFAYLGVVRENQEEYDFLHFVFLVMIGDKSPQLLEPEKCEGWNWYEPDGEIEGMLPGHAAALQLWREGKLLIDLANPIEY